MCSVDRTRVATAGRAAPIHKNCTPPAGRSCHPRLDLQDRADVGRVELDFLRLWLDRREVARHDTAAYPFVILDLVLAGNESRYL